MGIRYRTQARGLTYTVVDDLTIEYRALFTGSLLDEVTGAPLGIPASIEADLPYANINAVEGSLFAITGYLDRVFPKLSVSGATLHLSIAADGYRPAAATVPVAAGTTDFPIGIGAIPMRPLPVRVQGRVVKASDRSPISGATVTSGDGRVMLMRSPLYFDHAAGLDVNAVSFVNAGAAHKLTAALTGGAVSAFLDSTAGLGGGQILSVGSAPSVELVVIRDFGPDPAQVNFVNALNASYAALSPVQPVNVAGPSGTAKLARNPNAGDGVLALLTPLAAAGIQVDDGAQTEYHLTDAVADSSGYYNVDGAAGVASLDLKASAGGFPTAEAIWFIVYNDPVNVVDFRL